MNDITHEGCRTYSIYAIERLTDGKSYVGLTSRPVPVRIKAHVDNAMSRRKVSRPGSLSSAIRQAILTGQRFEEAFTVSVLVRDLTEDMARAEETRWIILMEAAASPRHAAGPAQDHHLGRARWAQLHRRPA